VTDTGAGSPLPPSDAGAGSPLGASGDMGFGSPLAFSSDGPQLAITLRPPFTSRADLERRGFEAVYPEDGGELVELMAAWPIAGPYRVQLRDAAGALFPAADQGCLAGLRGRGDHLYANTSGDFLRFAMPRLRQGTYDLVVMWEGSTTIKTSALRVVARHPIPYTAAMLLGIGTYPELQRRPQDDP
jgi:hypothetical protein